MSNQDYYQDEQDDEDFLSEVKSLTLTKNELLCISDSMTLLMEHTSEYGRMHIPARQLMPSAGMPVPVELIQTIGIGVLIATDPANVSQEATLSFNVADLYLLRECCQSYIKINNELVGYNLLRKIYKVMLSDSMEERVFIDKLTSGIDFSLHNSQEVKNFKELEKLKEQKDDTTT